MNQTYNHGPRVCDFIEMYWVVEGELEFVMEGRKQRFLSGDVGFYFPGDTHLQRALSRKLEFRFMTMDSTVAPAIILAYNLQREPFPAGPCPEDLFLQLEAVLKEPTAAAEYQAEAIGLRILNMALARRGGIGGKNIVSEKFKKLVENYFSSANCDVQFLADKLGMHRSTLYRIFFSETGSAPGDYLIRFRLKEALELLRNSECTIKEIAARCGFTDANYFTKSFRKHYSVPPTYFR